MVFHTPVGMLMRPLKQGKTRLAGHKTFAVDYRFIHSKPTARVLYYDTGPVRNGGNGNLPCMTGKKTTNRGMRMEITEEEFLTDEEEQAAEDILKEACPLSWEQTVREFEDYLWDIGVRI